MLFRSMCFHWKSLLRQIRIRGEVTQIEDEVADKYYNTRGYESRIGAWASKQSKDLSNREELMNSIKEYKKKYNDENNVPRPSHWSGWNLSPSSIEFWLDGDSRIHIESIGDLDNFIGHKEFEFPFNYLKTLNSNTFIIGNKLNKSLIKLLKI